MSKRDEAALAVLDQVKAEYHLTDQQVIECLDTYEAERGKRDLYYLTTSILGYQDLEPLHRDLCLTVESINTLVVAIAGTKANVWVGEGGKRGLATAQNSATFSNLPINSTNKKEIIANLRFSCPAVSENFAENYLSFSETAKHRLFLLFRGSFKTTIISIAHTIQLMLIYPDIRILIASHKKEGGSQEILRAIKAHFTQNKKFRRLYPEFCPQPNEAGVIDWGTTEKVTLPNRSDTAIFPEATIEIAGVTTDVTGRHYNVIKADDLVTKDSVTNEQMLEKTEQYNSLLKFLFDQPEWGILDYSGTPYHFADLYAGLRESTAMTKVIVPVTKKDGSPTLSRFSKDGIEAIKNDPSMTSYVFSCQYDLLPVAEIDQTFKPEWWKRPNFYYDELPSNLRFHVFCDPASTQKKDSDYTAIIGIGIDSDGIIYLTDIIRDKLDETQRIKAVLALCKKRGINRVNYESIGFQSTDCANLKKLSRTEDYPLVINEIKASAISKDDRIRSLQPVYERGDIRWPRKYPYYSSYHKMQMDMVDILRKELQMFPSVKFKDLSDCHSFMMRISLFKADKRAIPAEEDKLDMIIRKMVLEKPLPQARNRKFGGQLPFRESIL